MRDTMTVAGWVGGAMLISVCLMVLTQHAEGERIRAAVQAEQAHVDSRIRTLDARLTDLQADTNRKKLVSAGNPPLDPKRLVKASQELDQLIGKPAPAPQAAAPPSPAPDTGADVLSGPATGAPNAAAGSADDTAAADMVRICPGGHFYHRRGCKRVRKVTRAVTRAAAEQRGFRPCPTCRP
jgi:hypothetical protein